MYVSLCVCVFVFVCCVSFSLIDFINKYNHDLTAYNRPYVNVLYASSTHSHTRKCTLITHQQAKDYNKGVRRSKCLKVVIDIAETMCSGNKTFQSFTVL